MALQRAAVHATESEKYGFEPSGEWLNHLQKASVRFNSGGSGSFVSANGLCITNHHVGADALQKFGDEQHNYLRDGFYAKTQAEEKPCLDLELNVLMSIEDVTARVNDGRSHRYNSVGLTHSFSITPRWTMVARRRSVIAEIEKESKDKTGLRSDVVTLYEGGSYQLYRFKRYTDVRLVFAPEQQAAFLRRRPRQLRVSAFRPGYLHFPRLRKRSASTPRAIPQVEPQRHESNTNSSSSAATPAAPTASSPSTPWLRSAISLCPGGSNRSTG